MKVMTKLLLNVFLLVLITLFLKRFRLESNTHIRNVLTTAKKTMSKVQNIRIY